MNPSIHPLKTTDQRLSWRQPPFATLFIVLIAFRYEELVSEGFWMGLPSILATVVGFSPLLLFGHLGKNQYAKQWITALSLIPVAFPLLFPKFQTDDPPRLPPTIWEAMTRTVTLALPCSLVILLVAFLAYRDWKQTYEKEAGPRTDAARQEFNR